MVKIEYDFDINDWLAFHKYHLKNSKRFRKIKNRSLYSLPLIFALYICFKALIGESDPVGLAILATISIIWIIIYPRIFNSNSLKAAKKTLEEGDNSGIIGKHELQFDDDGIRMVTPQSDAMYKWAGINKYGETDDYIFLYDTAVSGIIIPLNKLSIDPIDLKKLIKDKLPSISGGVDDL